MESDKGLKIAVLRKKYSFHGGAEGFSQSLIEEFSAADHEVHLYAIQWKGMTKTRNIIFHRVPAITFNSFLREFTFALSSFFLMKKTKGEVDIIQSHDKTLYQDVYRAGDGCHIEWLRQRWLRSGLLGKLSIVLNPYHWLILSLERMIFRGHRYRKILAISELVKKNIMDNYRVPADDIQVIYNGIDLGKYHPGNRAKYRIDLRSRYGISESDIVVLFVGSGFERKGVKYLIQAVESLSDPVTVLIVGKGSEEQFKDLIKQQKIIFCGPQRNIEKYYAAADFFVFPTIYEPFGNVHLEALASGLPVITTRNSGAAEIIEQGVNGFVVERPEDYRAIAEKIKILLDGNAREPMSRNARLLAEKFTFKRCTDEIMKLYNRIIAQKKKSPGR
jgi:UDP-glucose:(heptosyl)LPS alpha-1,3-glucosyltransferase